MCRLLLVKAAREFSIQEQLVAFAEMSKNSKEYQGHGWGCAYLQEGQWRLYKNIRPIWEDDLSQFQKTRLLVGHARSAFKDEGIVVENNMPFYDGRYVFIFNGELRGVKISEKGRIGAEKIFNYIKRFDRGDMLEALQRGVAVIQKRTQYVRAMNIIIADMERAYLASLFSEQPEYFTMHYKEAPDSVIICSESAKADEAWKKIENGTIRAFG